MGEVEGREERKFSERNSKNWVLSDKPFFSIKSHKCRIPSELWKKNKAQHRHWPCLACLVILELVFTKCFPVHPKNVIIIRTMTFWHKNHFFMYLESCSQISVLFLMELVIWEKSFKSLIKYFNQNMASLYGLQTSEWII